MSDRFEQAYDMGVLVVEKPKDKEQLENLTSFQEMFKNQFQQDIEQRIIEVVKKKKNT